MGLDAFGRMVRDIRHWFISKLQEKYGISDMHAQSLIKFMNERGEKNCPGMIEKTQRVTQTPQLTKL